MPKELTSLLRKQLRRTRNALSDIEQFNHAYLAFEYFKSFLKRQAKTPLRIAFFYSQDGELETITCINHLWQETPHQVYLPTLETGACCYMQFARYQSNSKMKMNRFKLFEPDLPIEQHISGGTLDLVFMPLIGFDHSGNRLGMGGGYYDRSFAFRNNIDNRKSTTQLIGWAHSCQKVVQLHKKDWDVPLDYIITEQGIINFPTNV